MNTTAIPTPEAPNARPRVADCCGVVDSPLTPLKKYGNDLVCEPHFHERRTNDAKEEEVARALRPLFESRYRNNIDGAIVESCVWGRKRRRRITADR